MFIGQVLVRLVGADDHVYPNFIDVMQWLAESNLLEMIVDKLSPSVSKIYPGLCSLSQLSLVNCMMLTHLAACHLDMLNELM